MGSMEEAKPCYHLVPRRAIREIGTKVRGGFLIEGLDEMRGQGWSKGKVEEAVHVISRGSRVVGIEEKLNRR
jgi:hypothetical protein